MYDLDSSKLLRFLTSKNCESCRRTYIPRKSRISTREFRQCVYCRFGQRPSVTFFDPRNLLLWLGVELH
jgi:hypothetical protein